MPPSDICRRLDVQVPPTMTADCKAVGARAPPHCLSLWFAPACAISGYETGDLIDGCCEGQALTALILNVSSYVVLALLLLVFEDQVDRWEDELGVFMAVCGSFLGSVYALRYWTPDPSQIRGDGTQRTVHNKWLASCCIPPCAGPMVIGFWESGDMFRTADGTCTWRSGDACVGLILTCLPPWFGLPSLGPCFVCCCWFPKVTPSSARR